MYGRRGGLVVSSLDSWVVQVRVRALAGVTVLCSWAPRSINGYRQIFRATWQKCWGLITCNNNNNNNNNNLYLYSAVSTKKPTALNKTTYYKQINITLLIWKFTIIKTNNYKKSKDLKGTRIDYHPIRGSSDTPSRFMLWKSDLKAW